MNTNIGKTTAELRTKPTILRYPDSRVSRGGIEEINPDDIVYGEYAGDHNNYGNWIDVVYLDDDILRTFSGAVSARHPIIEELKLLLRDEKAFYVVPVKELPTGFAFKRTDIVDIKASSTIAGNENHVPSCVWTMYFKDRNIRTLEAEYQSYFTYGNTIRPRSMTNIFILDKVFKDNDKRQKP